MHLNKSSGAVIMKREKGGGISFFVRHTMPHTGPWVTPCGQGSHVTWHLVRLGHGHKEGGDRKVNV